MDQLRGPGGPRTARAGKVAAPRNERAILPCRGRRWQNPWDSRRPRTKARAEAPGLAFAQGCAQARAVHAVPSGPGGCDQVTISNGFGVKLLRDRLIRHRLACPSEAMSDHARKGATGQSRSGTRMPGAAGQAGVKWVAYMDESGNRTGKDIEGESDLFVLACVTGSPDTLARLADMVRGMKRGLAPGFSPDRWELHGKEIVHGPEKGPFRAPLLARTVPKKIAILRGIADIVHEVGADIIVAVVPCKKIRRDHGKNHVMEYAMAMLLERLELLARVRGVDVVRIVSDEMRRGDQERAAAILSSMSLGHSAISSVRATRLSGIEYVSSMSSVLNQVADVVAYAINRSGGGGREPWRRG